MFNLVNRIALDGTPRLAASNLRLYSLPMSHKKDAMLLWVKPQSHIHDFGHGRATIQPDLSNRDASA